MKIVESGDGPHLVLEVDDFDKTIEHLRNHKVPFALEPAVMPPGCRAAIVVDPDGNKLGIHKRKAGPEPEGGGESADAGRSAPAIQ